MSSKVYKSTAEWNRAVGRRHARLVIEFEVSEYMKNHDSGFFKHITHKIMSAFYHVKVNGGWILFNSPIDYMNYKSKKK